MSKELKKYLTTGLESRLGNLQEGCVLIDYRGLNAEQTYDLRHELRRGGIRMMVVHNRLARRVFAQTSAPDTFQGLFRGPTAVLTGRDGALGASKSIVQWRKKNKDLAPIKGGLFQGKALSAEEVGRLAQLPDVATLRTRALSMFLGPMSHLASAAASLLGNFAGCVKARTEALQAGGGGAEPQGAPAAGGEAASQPAGGGGGA